MPVFKPGSNWGELYGPALEVKTKEEAQKYLQDLAEYFQVNALEGKYRSAEGALELAKNNLGYYIGYYGEEARARAYELFGIVHPAFGKEV